MGRDFGRDDPYFGVLSHEEYSGENLTPTGVEKFFKSGEAHVAQLLALIERTTIPLRSGRVLDFGCGVGRLLIPLATRFCDANGVDVSEGMLTECKKNLEHRKLTNVESFRTNSEFRIRSRPQCFGLSAHQCDKRLRHHFGLLVADCARRPAGYSTSDSVYR